MTHQGIVERLTFVGKQILSRTVFGEQKTCFSQRRCGSDHDLHLRVLVLLHLVHILTRDDPSTIYFFEFIDRVRHLASIEVTEFSRLVVVFEACNLRLRHVSHQFKIRRKILASTIFLLLNALCTLFHRQFKWRNEERIRPRFSRVDVVSRNVRFGKGNKDGYSADESRNRDVNRKFIELSYELR